MREPTAMWAWPKQIKTGIVQEMGSTLDLLPTFAGLIGAKLSTDRTYDGHDLSPVLLGTGPSPRKSMFYYHGEQLYAVRSGLYKAHFKTKTSYVRGAKMEEHEVVCIVTIFPISEESELLHYPNIKFTKLQSESMNIPQISIKVDSTNPNSEAKTLKEILIKAKEEFKIQGIVHGGILSEFQKKQFEEISQNLGITLISPLWKKNEKEYMNDLLESKFHFIPISVTSDG